MFPVVLVGTEEEEYGWSDNITVALIKLKCDLCVNRDVKLLLIADQTVYQLLQ